VIASVPEERLFVRTDDEPFKIDASIGKHLAVGIRKVAADNTDEADVLAEVPGCKCQVGGAAPKHALGLAERRLDGVKSDSSYSKDAHGLQVWGEEKRVYHG